MLSFFHAGVVAYNHKMFIETLRDNTYWRRNRSVVETSIRNNLCNSPLRDCVISFRTFILPACIESLIQMFNLFPWGMTDILIHYGELSLLVESIISLRCTNSTVATDFNGHTRTRIYFIYFSLAQPLALQILSDACILFSYAYYTHIWLNVELSTITCRPMFSDSVMVTWNMCRPILRCWATSLYYGQNIIII